MLPLSKNSCYLHRLLNTGYGLGEMIFYTLNRVYIKNLYILVSKYLLDNSKDHHYNDYDGYLYQQAILA